MELKNILHKPYPKDNRFLISEYGDVFDTALVVFTPEFQKGVYLQEKDDKRGYIAFDLYDSGKPWERVKKHELVAYTYLGERPEGYIIDHIDEDKHNNHFFNLQYISRSENGLRSKLSERDYSRVGLIVKFDDGTEVVYRCSPHNIAKELGIHSRRMYDLIDGNIKSHKNIAGVQVLEQKLDYCTIL